MNWLSWEALNVSSHKLNILLRGFVFGLMSTPLICLWRSHTAFLIECKKPAIGYSLNGQESLFEYPNRYSVVVYVILTRTIFLWVPRSFSFLCILRFRDLTFTLPHKKAFCAVQSQSSQKTSGTIFMLFLCYSLKAFQQPVIVFTQLFCCKCMFPAWLWYCFIFLTSVTKTCPFVSLPLFRI